MAKHSIGIIGAGNVGLAVGMALSRAGHDVVFGLREGSSSNADVAKEGGIVVSIEEAAQRPVVVVAVPFRALGETIRGAGPLDRTILIDATNPMGASPSSGAEELARFAPNARVVKAFNTTGFENMANADRLAQPPFMPICGDDDEAKKVVAELAREVGFDAHDAGPLKNAALLESFAQLWVTMVRRGLGRDWAFAITKVG